MATTHRDIPPLGGELRRKLGATSSAPAKTAERRGAEERAHFSAGHADPNSSVSYSAAPSRVWPARPLGPFVKPPPLDAELLVGADPPSRPPVAGQGAAAARVTAGAFHARTPNVARAATATPSPTWRLDAARRRLMLAAPGPGEPLPRPHEPGVVRVDARRGVADREGADAQGTVAIQKAPTPAAAPPESADARGRAFPNPQDRKAPIDADRKGPTLSPHKGSPAAGRQRGGRRDACAHGGRAPRPSLRRRRRRPRDAPPAAPHRQRTPKAAAAHANERQVATAAEAACSQPCPK